MTLVCDDILLKVPIRYRNRARRDDTPYLQGHSDVRPLTSSASSVSVHTPFYPEDSDYDPNWIVVKPLADHAVLDGDFYSDADSNVHLVTFRPPRRASTKTVRPSSEYEVLLDFLGTEYLRMRLPWQLVYMRHEWEVPSERPAGAPKQFEFFGILHDEAQERACREPSPRETWFEINHPMGAWKESRRF